MDIQLRQPGSLEDMQKKLKSRFPEYTYSMHKTLYGPMLVVQKSAFIGTGIRLVKDGKVAKVFATIPSVWARVMMGGILFIAFIWGKLKRLEKTVGEFIAKEYGQ